jgi:imidazole glycerol-phosphate synthase subunit HisH
VSAPRPEPPAIGLVDYGMGNRRSVEKALERAGARPLVTADHERLRGANGLVLPGVGAFPHAMERIRALGLDELLRERVQAGVPVLGICLGVQLAFEFSPELGGAEGIGLVPGQVVPLQAGGLKLPLIAWTEVTVVAPPDRLFDGLGERSAFYHVHSFAPAPAEERDVIATAEYGARFATAVRHGSFAGVQFHPEKSSRAGLRLLENFAGICAAAAGAEAQLAP